MTKPIPEGMHSLTPHLVCRDANAAMDFYAKAFGAVDCGRLPGSNGTLMHGMMKIGDSSLMLVDEMPEWGSLGPQALNGSPVTLHLYVEDVDAAFARALAAGARETMPVADMFWGDRYGQLVDPYGHRWSLATHVRDMTPEQIRAASARRPRPNRAAPCTRKWCALAKNWPRGASCALSPPCCPTAWACACAGAKARPSCATARSPRPRK